MAKLSISLPNNTQITLESEEAEVVHDALGMVLRGLPTEAAPESVPAPQAANGENGAVEKGTDTPVETANEPASSPSRRANGAAPRQVSNGESLPSGPSFQPAGTPVNAGANVPLLPANESGDDGLDLIHQTQQSREDFTAFCQSLNPMGDMRRVVVAAEAAVRFFGAEGVSADDLGELFDLAGWRRANSFTQTLRNAARSKFGWLERIPGRSGRYAATDLGRSITLAG